ncbi:MAG: glutamate-cysteine ligase family protein [bacterium]|nr:glutamate-cysteine ligase family protein [bacterium]MDY3861730.1 glutamate-cysteine ligase family protein [Ruminococcus sp.]
MKDYTEYNLNFMTEYFEKGCKNSKDRKIGIEVENFLIEKDTKEPVSFYGDGGVEQLLKSLSENFESEHRENGRLLGLSGKDYSLTVEPGGQLEISMIPKKSIEEIEKTYREFLNLILPLLEKENCLLVNCGYHPSFKCGDIPLIPKNRYRVMDDYFNELGTCGMNMMRGSASVQVNIDYCSPRDFKRKYKLANLLAPVIYLICDNSPVFEGEENHKNCVRAGVWRSLDKKRCALPVKKSFDDFGFREYAEFVYNSVPLFDREEKITSYTMTNREFYKDAPITKADVEHMISMVFPDVRLKTYLELRMADSMELEYALSYASLVKSLFSDDDAIDRGLGVFDSENPDDINNAVDAVMKNGFDAQIYGKSVKTIIKELFGIAEEKASESEKKYLAVLENLALQSKNLRMVKIGKH